MQLAFRPTHEDGLRDAFRRAALVARHRGRQAEVFDLWVIEYLVDRVDLAAGNADFIQLCDPLHGRAVACMVGDSGVDLFSMLRTPGTGVEIWVVEDGVLQQGFQLQPHMLAGAGNVDVAVGGLENAGGN